LLNTGNDAHPHGLANGSDQVGRNYTFHNCKVIVALSKEKNDTVFQKTDGPLTVHITVRSARRDGSEGVPGTGPGGDVG